MRLLCDLGIFFRAKNDLSQTFPIAQIDENDAAMIARDVHPAGERSHAANVDLAQLIAVMSAFHDSKAKKRVILSEAKNLSYSCDGK